MQSKKNRIPAPSVLIRTDGGKTQGLGHLYRSLTLAREFKKRGWTVCLWIRDDRMLRNIAGSKDIPVITASGSEEEVLTRINPAILITDLPPSFNRDALSSAARERGIFHAGIDDMGLAGVAADLSVNPGIVHPGEKPGRWISGGEYAIIEEKFRRVSSGRDGVKKVFISMGGSDPNRLTDLILKSLNRMEDEISLTVVRGPAAALPDKTAWNRPLKIVRSNNDMMATMAESDLAFLAGGITLYEAAAAGLPAIVIAQNEYQGRTGAEFHRRGAALYVGVFGDVSVSGIWDAYLELSSDHEKRAAMSRTAQRAIDGRGCGRVVGCIERASRNREAVKTHHPYLLQHLDTAAPSRLEPRVEKSREGSPALSVLTPDRVRIYLHSRYDPVSEAETISASCGVRKTDTPVVILGGGLGYLPLTLARRLEPHQHLVIVEPCPEILRLGFLHLDLCALLTRPNTRLVTGPSFLEELRALVPDRGYTTSYIVHSPSLRLTPKLGQAVSFLEKTCFARIRKVLDYPKCAADPLRVLLFEGGFYIEKELKAGLHRLGIPFHTLSVKVSGKGDAGFISRFLETAAGFRPDFVLTINRMGFDREGVLAGLMDHYNLPHVSWFVDNPIPLLAGSGGNASETGLSLVWDEHYVEPLKRLGYQRVAHLPYAADSTIFYPSPALVPKRYDLSFVGSSMTGIIAKRLDEIREYPRLMEIFKKLAGTGPPPGFSGETGDLIRAETGTGEYTGRALFSLEVALNSQWTQDHRVSLLLSLSEFRPHLFGDAGWKRLLPGSFHLHPPVDYRTELPDVYRATAINLNISHLQLRSSVNQRLFDVCSCGSFLLSDRRTAVEHFLRSGESVETFETAEDLREKAAYYTLKGHNINFFERLKL